MESKIEWEDEKQGWRINPLGMKTRVKKPIYALQDMIIKYCRSLVLSTEKWKSGDYQPYKIIRLDPMFSSIPPLSGVLEIMKKIIPAKLEKLCVADYSSAGDDFIFLASLGKKRNWRSGCCICLTDNMMGTTCKCGHFEIAIFRPCGHSICVNPCFYEMAKSAGIKLQPQKYSYGDQIFYAPTVMDITSAKDFSCPLCRQNVAKVFRAENVSIPVDGYPTFNVAKIAEDIMLEADTAKSNLV